MDLVGRKIRNIRVLELLGKGGMGNVYLGFDEALQRKVALKAIKPSKRLDHENKARFLREARLLSQLEHPHICRIHDFIEEDDQELLVLELVEGATLKEALKAGPSERTKHRIAGQLAEVLVAAHHAGVIHRDLKPDNVMVTRSGQVKVLDFGLARSGVSRLTEGSETQGAPADAFSLPPLPEDRTCVAAAGELATTLLAATVAAAGSGGETDPPGEDPRSGGPRTGEPRSGGPRTGEPRSGEPRSGDSSTNVSVLEISDVHTRYGSIVGTVSYMSPEQARGEPLTTASDMYSLGLLLHEIFGDETAYQPDLPMGLKIGKVARAETRPVKGLDPDLADLIGRLESLVPDSRPRAEDVLDRLRWIRERPRRRGRRILAAAAVLLVLLAGAKHSVDVRREQQRTLTALAEAERARAEAQQVSDFLVEVFEVTEPGQARGSEITAREVLARGAERLEHELAGQPLVRARLFLTVGMTYHGLGLYEEAAGMLERAVELQRAERRGDHLDLASSLSKLAETYYILDRYEESTKLFEESLAMYRRLLPAGHPKIAADLEELGRIRFDQGRIDEARAMLEQALAIRRAALEAGHPDLASNLWTLADVLGDQGDLPRAEELYRETLGILERTREADHPLFATALEGFGSLYLDHGRYGEAAALFRRSAAIREKVLGPDHPNLGISLSYLGYIDLLEGRFEEAEAHLERALRLFERSLGPDHYNVGANLIFLGEAHLRARRLDEAEAAYARSLAIFEKAGLADNNNALTALLSLGDVAAVRGDLEVAEGFFRRALEGWERTAGAASPEGIGALAALASTVASTGGSRAPEAEELFARCLELLGGLAAGWSDNPELLQIGAEVRYERGKLRADGGDAQDSRRLWLEARGLLERPEAGLNSDFARAALYAKVLLRLDDIAAARPVVRRLREVGWADEELWELAEAGGAGT